MVWIVIKNGTEIYRSNKATAKGDAFLRFATAIKAISRDGGSASIHYYPIGREMVTVAQIAY